MREHLIFAGEVRKRLIEETTSKLGLKGRSFSGVEGGKVISSQTGLIHRHRPVKCHDGEC